MLISKVAAPLGNQTVNEEVTSYEKGDYHRLMDQAPLVARPVRQDVTMKKLASALVLASALALGACQQSI